MRMSLEYTGISSHKDEPVGLYDTVLSTEDYRTNLLDQRVYNFRRYLALTRSISTPSAFTPSKIPGLATLIFTHGAPNS